jgi:hypothetical protein
MRIPLCLIRRNHLRIYIEDQNFAARFRIKLCVRPRTRYELRQTIYWLKILNLTVFNEFYASNIIFNLSFIKLVFPNNPVFICNQYYQDFIHSTPHIFTKSIKLHITHPLHIIRLLNILPTLPTTQNIIDISFSDNMEPFNMLNYIHELPTSFRFNIFPQRIRLYKYNGLVLPDMVYVLEFKEHLGQKLFLRPNYVSGPKNRSFLLQNKFQPLFTFNVEQVYNDTLLITKLF